MYVNVKTHFAGAGAGLNSLIASLPVDKQTKSMCIRPVANISLWGTRLKRMPAFHVVPSEAPAAIVMNCP